MENDKKGEGYGVQEELREWREDDALLHFYQVCVLVARGMDALCRHGSPCKDNLSHYHSVLAFLALSLSL